MSENANPSEPQPMTSRAQFDALIPQAEQAFLNARLQAAAQEGFLQGLLRARELWDDSLKVE